MTTTMDSSIIGPTVEASASVVVPPPITLPVPEFAIWADAVAYARGMFARTRYLEAQVGTRERPGALATAVSDSQIALAAAEAELAALLEAARNLLVQGKELA